MKIKELTVNQIIDFLIQSFYTKKYMTHMNVSFRYICSYFKMIILLDHYLKDNILCSDVLEEDIDESTYVFVQSNEEEFENIENKEENESFEYFTSLEFGQLPKTTPKESQDSFDENNFKITLKEQNELIKKIECILNKSRNNDDWENVDEQEYLKNLCDKFRSLTLLIQNYMVDAHLKLKNIYDFKLTSVFNNILSILNVKNELSKKIKLYRNYVSKFVRLKSTMRKTMIFYKQMSEEYTLQNNKFDETSKCIEKFKNTFDLALKLIEVTFGKNKKEAFIIIRNRMQRILKMFDINQKSSIYKADKLIKNSIEKSLVEISSIDDEIKNFLHL